MPFPTESFTINGGCNCRAIRYQVQVPDYGERPQTVYKTPGSDIGDLRLPAVYLDHCNDCRRANTAVIGMVLVTITDTVRVSVLPNSAKAEYAFQVPDSDRDWSPASQVFDPNNAKLESLHLKVYNSSPGRLRWFCGRCGTPVAYSIEAGIVPKEWGWPPMFDIWLGTVDREDLEEDYMKPERALWCDMGIPWVREMVRIGAGGIPEHPLTKIDKLVGVNDVGSDLKELSSIGSHLKQ